MKKQIKWIIVLSVISLFVLNSYYIGSIAAMLYYNNYNMKNSDMGHYIENIEMDRPDGDWYPLMNKYFAQGFSNFADEDVDLLIMYSYGDFSKGTSTMFDIMSTQYNSFYGCYIIENNGDGYYGYGNDGDLQEEKIAMVAEYDFKYLVTGDMGLEADDFFLEYEIIDSEKQADGQYLEIQINTNSIYHLYKGFNANYIQYGIPYKRFDKQDFYPMDIYCKMKIEKLENNAIVVYYILTPTKELINSWNGGKHEGLHN